MGVAGFPGTNTNKRALNKSRSGGKINEKLERELWGLLVVVKSGVGGKRIHSPGCLCVSESVRGRALALVTHVNGTDSG